MVGGWGGARRGASCNCTGREGGGFSCLNERGGGSGLNEGGGESGLNEGGEGSGLNEGGGGSGLNADARKSSSSSWTGRGR